MAAATVHPPHHLPPTFPAATGRLPSHLPAVTIEEADGSEGSEGSQARAGAGGEGGPLARGWLRPRRGRGVAPSTAAHSTATVSCTAQRSTRTITTTHAPAHASRRACVPPGAAVHRGTARAHAARSNAAQHIPQHLRRTHGTCNRPSAADAVIGGYGWATTSTPCTGNQASPASTPASTSRNQAPPASTLQPHAGCLSPNSRGRGRGRGHASGARPFGILGY